MDRYAGLVGVEGQHVTVQAGMKLCVLNDVLAQHGLALPVHGTIAEQTVSGAIPFDRPNDIDILSMRPRIRPSRPSSATANPKLAGRARSGSVWP